MNITNEKLLIKKILENPFPYKWSLQGLGMLRLYLSDEVRLHIWDSRYVVTAVSTMHTHPWDFYSVVIAGEVKNMRYTTSRSGELFNAQTIRCGVGGCLISDSRRTRLLAHPFEIYTEGMEYTQKASEIHESFPDRGTITLVTRSFKKDRDHAQVFWPLDEKWVSAEPREASRKEVKAITSFSLDRWFK